MIKRHFIPHESNNHRPHILQRKSIRQILILIILCEMIVFVGAGLMRIDGRFGTASVVPIVLAELTNNERNHQNLESLVVSEKLNTAATLKAEDMATKNYFAHTSPEGKTPWYWLHQAGYEYQYAGENLAVDFTDSNDVARAWMNSPTHKSNIVKEKYTQVGTGVAEGTFEGKNTIFVAQVYANPLIVSHPNPIAVQKEKPNEPNDTNEPTEIFVGNQSNSQNEGYKRDMINLEEINHAMVLGAETLNDDILTESSPNLIQRILASPKTTANTLLTIIVIVIFLSLSIYLIIKRKKYHADLIINALAVIVIIGAIFLVNYLSSNEKNVIIQSIDYENKDMQQ